MRTGTTGIVFDIKEFAVFDGPGIRTTVFMKGCPLRCQWCHNPEGLGREPEIMVSRAACVHCGACEQVCKHPDACTACGQCVAACRGGFRKIIGKEWTAEQLAQRLIKDADIYQLSGGGVTFSGGEPLMQWDFVSNVIAQLPGVSTAIETSGYASDQVFSDAMARCSLILIDWKVSDPDLHRRYTGVDQSCIRRHIEMLANGNTPFILRMPIIPNVNDNEAHFQTAAEMVVGSRWLIRVEVLPYQRAAGAKYEMVNRTYEPDFADDTPPKFFTECFERLKIPYEVFR